MLRGPLLPRAEREVAPESRVPKVVLLSLLLLSDLWVVLRSKSSVLGSLCVML